MTSTSPAAGLKGSRLHPLTFYLGSLSGTTDTTLHYLGNATTGVPFGRPFRVASISISGAVTADTADGTLTATVYKGSVAAGNRAVETTLALTAIADVGPTASTTVVNAGMDIFTATEGIIVRLFYDGGADSVTAGSINVTVLLEWDI